MIGQPTRSWWPLLAVAALLLMVGGAAAVATPQLTRIPVPAGTGDAVPEETATPPEPPTPTPEETPSAEAAQPSVPGWILPLLGALLLAFVIGGLLTTLWIVARGRLRTRPGQLDEPAPATASAEPEEVVAAVDAGLSDLSDADLDPRRAVIGCWVRLEQVAAAAGAPRQVSDTPTDLVTRLLAAHYVDPHVLAAFADTYRLARYTTHTVDERMRAEARSALERVRTALTGVMA